MSGAAQRLRVTASEAQFFLAPLDMNPVPVTANPVEVVDDVAIVVAVDEFVEVVDVEFRPTIRDELVVAAVEMYVAEPLFLASPTLYSDPPSTYRAPATGWHTVTVAKSPRTHPGGTSCYVFDFSPGRNPKASLADRDTAPAADVESPDVAGGKTASPVYLSSSFEIAAGEFEEGEEPVADEKLDDYKKCLSVLAHMAESGSEPAVIGMRPEEDGDTLRIWWYEPVPEEVAREMSVRALDLNIIHERAPHSPEHLRSLANRAGLQRLAGVAGMAVRCDGRGIALSALRSADLDKLASEVADKAVGVPVWIGPGLL